MILLTRLTLYRTYVQWGLACMADGSKILSVDAAPLSLRMRSVETSTKATSERRAKKIVNHNKKRSASGDRDKRLTQRQQASPTAILHTSSTLSFLASLGGRKSISQCFEHLLR